MNHAKAIRHSQCARRADLAVLAATIKVWGRELGFQAVGIADTDLSTAEPRLAAWIERGFGGEMDYMRRHGAKRTQPAALVPGTLRVISARMDYRPRAADSSEILGDGSKAFVARYALGRDYHKVLRGRLQRLAERIEAEVGEFGYRVFTDSAPVMEVELARKAGLGWRGKHTLLLSIRICPCPWTRRSASIAGPAKNAWAYVQRGRSSLLMSSTRGAAFPISRSN
jgi:epoxyqueuosine reductase